MPSRTDPTVPMIHGTAADSLRRHTDRLLIAAYHQTKALHETLRALSSAETRLTIQQDIVVKAAARDVAIVMDLLNASVADQGNENGALMRESAGHSPDQPVL